ncbi:50S ribosomal protein L22 [Candidatus Micrarchaeota archaeon]|nr:50S ribosomal protein L22 [Candidatus Micrarchaeota archaeon]
MGLYKYSVKHAEKVGKAQAHDLDASYKDLTQVLRAITGLSVEKAFAKLDAAIKGEHAILYTRFNTGSGHRSELGGKKGRYPKKECKMVYATLKNAAANAVNLGLDEKSLVVMHGSANKQNTFRRYRTFWVGSTTLGYGKHAMWADYVTAWMQIIVGGKPAEKKEVKPKAAKEKSESKESTEKTPKPVEAKAITDAKADEKPPAKTESKPPAPKAEKAKGATTASQ